MIPCQQAHAAATGPVRTTPPTTKPSRRKQQLLDPTMDKLLLKILKKLKRRSSVLAFSEFGFDANDDFLELMMYCSGYYCQ